MELVWISYFNTLIVIIVALKFLHLIYNYYVRKILIIKPSNAASSKKEFVKKHINVFNNGAKGYYPHFHPWRAKGHPHIWFYGI